jgi:hypothetical protein
LFAGLPFGRESQTFTGKNKKNNQLFIYLLLLFINCLLFVQHVLTVHDGFVITGVSLHLHRFRLERLYISELTEIDWARGSSSSSGSLPLLGDGHQQHSLRELVVEAVELQSVALGQGEQLLELALASLGSVVPAFDRGARRRSPLMTSRPSSMPTFTLSRAMPGRSAIS